MARNYACWRARVDAPVSWGHLGRAGPRYVMRLRYAQRVIALVAALSAGAVVDASAADAASPADTRDVLVASNNWEGTTDFIDPQSFQRLMRLNIVPDRDERLAEIQSDPVAFAYYLLVQQEIGE